MCSKKHFLKRTGIYEVLEFSKHSGMLSAIERECKCIIKLPKELESAITQNVADYEVIDAEPVESKYKLIKIQFEILTTHWRPNLYIFPYWKDMQIAKWIRDL